MCSNDGFGHDDVATRSPCRAGKTIAQDLSRGISPAAEQGWQGWYWNVTPWKNITCDLPTDSISAAQKRCSSS